MSLANAVTKLENWFSSLFVAAVFVLLGALLFYFTRDVSTLTCSRAGEVPDCVLSVRTFKNSAAREIPLRGLDSAFVEESCDDEGDCTYRLVLNSAAGQQAMTMTYDSARAEKEEKAVRVNQFLSDASIASLEISEGGGVWPYLGLILIGVGLVLVLRLGWMIIRSTFLGGH